MKISLCVFFWVNDIYGICLCGGDRGLKPVVAAGRYRSFFHLMFACGKKGFGNINFSCVAIIIYPGALDVESGGRINMFFIRSSRADLVMRGQARNLNMIRLHFLIRCFPVMGLSEKPFSPL